MRKAAVASTVLAALALVAPVGAQGAERGAKSLRIAVELPLTVGAPGPDCPASSFLALDYRISSKGRQGTGTNCVVDFAAVDCAPALCSNVSLVITFRLPGGTITAEGSLLETAPCDPASAPACTTVDHKWSGEVVDATRGFHKFEGAAISGGGIARYRYPADPVQPFASLGHYVVVIGDDVRSKGQ